VIYVIVRDDGKFVAPPGQEKSYSDKLQDAWGFPTREAAQRQVCPGNERIVPITDIIAVL
jgi:hypothetical protein